jgi:U3 small nucleolar RNA-associated protein 18
LWAERARDAKRKGKAVSSDTSDSDSDAQIAQENDASSDLSKLLHSSSAGIRKNGGTRMALPAGELDVTRVRDANQVEKANKSPITALEFHHSASVLFTTSEDRKLKLYQVDGSHNPLLQSVHLPELPISSASFHPSGSSILMTGPRPFFYSYDLQAGRVIRSPRGLWSAGLGGSDGAKNDKNGGGMELFRFSPDGRLVAVAGRRGYVHLLDWGTDGKGMMAGGNGGQVIGQIKVNTGIKGLNWNKSGTELVVTGDDAVVSSWDIGTRQCLQRWNDDGGFAPSCTALDRSERYFAVG